MKIITQQTRTAQSLSPKLVGLKVEFEIDCLNSGDVRHRFLNAVRIAIAKARMAGSISQAVCDELWCAVSVSEIRA
jgi:hypothetical protein